MISIRIGCSLINRNILNKHFLRLSSTSIQPVSKEKEDFSEKELKQYETLTNITKRTRRKKPQRPPFVKNLLVGNFDSEVLTFPQLENDELQNVEQGTEYLEKLLKQRHMVNVNSLSNKNFRQNLADARAIGLQASQLLDGRECTPLEVARYLEVLAEHNLNENLIHHEQLCVQTLVKFGSDLQQKKYLHPLIKGEKMGAFCITELKISDINSIKTKAELSKDKKFWILNGNKSFVVNGISADYLVVFAVTNIVKRDTIREVDLTAFLVEKESTGVTCKKVDTCNNEIAEIMFNNTQVPVENVIGKVNEANLILNSIISDFRLSCGSACSTLTKKLLNNLHQTVLDESDENLQIYKTDAMRSKLGEIAMNLYAVESVTYLTAGLQDWYEKQDVTVESAIVKVFSSEVAYNTSTTCLDLLGLSATLKDHWSRKLHDEIINYLTLHETNDSQRIIIALNGLEHAGKEISEKVKKLRNPLYYGTWTLLRMWRERKNFEDNPNLDLKLYTYLHPSLVGQANFLEYCVKRLEFATERVLMKHGLEIINKHVDLRRLADIMIDCYVMTAVLARASRSYCIGLRNSDYEMVLATSFCNWAQERVKKNALSLYIGEFRTNDANFIAAGKQMTKSKGYFIKNPLTRNF